MERLTIRVPEDLSAAIEERSDTEDISESEAVRRLLQHGTEYESIKTERDRLERQLAAQNSRQDDVSELVEYVESEMTKQKRDRERRDAPVWRRAKWWVFGRTESDDTEAMARVRATHRTIGNPD